MYIYILYCCVQAGNVRYSTCCYFFRPWTLHLSQWVNDRSMLASNIQNVKYKKQIAWRSVLTNHFFPLSRNLINWRSIGINWRYMTSIETGIKALKAQKTSCPLQVVDLNFDRVWCSYLKSILITERKVSITRILRSLF